MSQIHVTIVGTAVGVVGYAICSMCRRKDVGWDDLMVFALNIIGAITGVYILAGSFEIAEVKPQNAIWSAVTGVCMAVIFLQKSVASVRAVLRKEVDPK